MTSATIVVRVDAELKRKLKEYGVNVSEVVRAALRREVERRESEELLALLKRAKEVLSKVSDEDIVEAVRSARLER